MRRARRGVELARQVRVLLGRRVGRRVPPARDGARHRGATHERGPVVCGAERGDVLVARRDEGAAARPAQESRCAQVGEEGANHPVGGAHVSRDVGDGAARPAAARVRPPDVRRLPARRGRGDGLVRGSDPTGSGTARVEEVSRRCRGGVEEVSRRCPSSKRHHESCAELTRKSGTPPSSRAPLSFAKMQRHRSAAGSARSQPGAPEACMSSYRALILSGHGVHAAEEAAGSKVRRHAAARGSGSGCRWRKKADSRSSLKRES